MLLNPTHIATCAYSLMTFSFSAYSVIKIIVIAGKIRHVKGTKIAGKNDADIVKIPVKLNYESQLSLL
ncbi:hypothetical protein RIVM261_083770 [Rivularia sp. IAM M-261]|nr:hypothetical protein CAL7716_000860 [Calothrix sp. PCC 7716]GJD23421.1 hypothetical protein RIVM261_083770 [Rivularia sp. IAM M-261]